MIRLTCEIEPDLVDALEDHLCEWEVSPWALVVNRLSDDGALDGYFTDQQEAKAAWVGLRSVFSELPEDPILSVVQDRDWQDAYKEHFQPWQTGALHIVPTWEKESYHVPVEHKALYLDPGMAFGTGNHETTRFCLMAVNDFVIERTDDLANLTCVDAGCGSGILSLSAKLLGIGEVKGFDLDPDAVRIANENADANHMSGLVDFTCADLATALSPNSADLLLANIQADVLCHHSSILLTALRPGGTLCLSGVLAKEIKEVEKIFGTKAKSLGGPISSSASDDGEWASIKLIANC